MTSSTRARRGVSFGMAAAHTAIITRRNVLRVVRIPQLILFSTIQPVMFLLLFNYVFGGAIDLGVGADSDQYINWLIPGILVQSAVFGATATALGLTEDLADGVIDRFRSLPMARSAVLTGRTAADLVHAGGGVDVIFGDQGEVQGAGGANQVTPAPTASPTAAPSSFISFSARSSVRGSIR